MSHDCRVAHWVQTRTSDNSSVKFAGSRVAALWLSPEKGQTHGPTPRVLVCRENATTDQPRRLYPLGVVMAMPEKDELPFYGEDEHETMTEAERVEMYQAWAEYRDNLRTGTKSDE